jgi:hypothetical protein
MYSSNNIDLDTSWRWVARFTPLSLNVRVKREESPVLPVIEPQFLGHATRNIFYIDYDNVKCNYLIKYYCFLLFWGCYNFYACDTLCVFSLYETNVLSCACRSTMLNLPRHPTFCTSLTYDGCMHFYTVTCFDTNPLLDYRYVEMWMCGFLTSLALSTSSI